MSMMASEMRKSTLLPLSISKSQTRRQVLEVIDLIGYLVRQAVGKQAHEPLEGKQSQVKFNGLQVRDKLRHFDSQEFNKNSLVN